LERDVIHMHALCYFLMEVKHIYTYPQNKQGHGTSKNDKANSRILTHIWYGAYLLSI